jgi:putative aldouronate transport system substrate-binding protein
MRTSSRRSVAFAATLAVAAALLASCSDDGGTPEPTGESTDGTELGLGEMADYAVGTTFMATEPVEFSLLYRDHPNYLLQDDWLILSALAENQNVTFDLVNVPLSDWATQKPTIVNSPDAPDLIPVTYTYEQATYAGTGTVLPISDYLDLMPNFQAKVAEWGLEGEIDNIRLADGKFYVLPGIHEQARAQYSIAIREDYWQQAGITEDPETWDEFAEDLQKIKDAGIDGLGYPLSDRWQMKSLLNQAAPGFSTKSGFDWGFANGLMWDDEAGEWVYAGAQDEQKELLTFFHDLVAEGLMDPDSFAQDDDTAKAKFGTGQSATISTNDQTIVNELRPLFEDAGNTAAKVRQIRVPAGPAGDLYPWGGRLESGLMISAAAAEKPYFNALLQFVDWLYYSDEGLEFAKWGVEGETFNREGDARVLLDDIGYNALNPDAPKKLNADFGFSNGEFMLAQGSTWDLSTSMLNDETMVFVDAMATKTVAPQPGVSPLTTEQSDQAGQLQTVLTDLVNINTTAFITGQRDLSEWDAYVDELRGAGMDDFVAIYNDALVK